MWQIYAKYDVTSESMMMGLAIVMLVIMFVSQPKVTGMYRIVAAGFGLGILTVLVHQGMLYLTTGAHPFSPSLFATAYVIYCLFYDILLNSIFGYVAMLSYQIRKNVKVLHRYMCVCYILFFAIMMVPLVTGKLYVIDANGVFSFTKWQYCINIAGALDAIFSWIVIIRNRKSITRIVGWGMTVFVPVELAILAFETIFNSVYFISYTYVLPFLLFFVLFHCTKYDDVVGCQDADAINTQIKKAIKKRKKYLLINVQFPQLQNRELGGEKSRIEYVSSEKCRLIEQLCVNIRLYSSGMYNFFLFVLIHSEEEADRIVEGVNKILLAPAQYENVIYKVYSKQIVIRENKELKSPRHVSSFLGYLRKNFNGGMVNERIIPTESDYSDFSTYYEIEQALLDIRAQGNMDDERVLCFIQPIHDIASESFKTGESLMRMKLKGKMIFPNQFIELAETTDCIHTLTRIMLNKVCKKIKELENKGYNFEAVTVNCSTLELEDKDFCREVYEIIESNGITTGHIRLEITESTSVENYDNVKFNMQKLNELGVSFYLDDFGTGYSNLDRIISCPFKTIKFDKSILYNAYSNSNMDEMMRMLVSFFNKNNMNTVVEGVEDKDQYEYCKDVGFDYIQGYLFSKPIPADNIVEFFTK